MRERLENLPETNVYLHTVKTWHSSFGLICRKRLLKWNRSLGKFIIWRSKPKTTAHPDKDERSKGLNEAWRIEKDVSRAGRSSAIEKRPLHSMTF